MPQSPEPSAAFLELLVRRCMARGVAAEDAEDIVLRCYHRVADRFDPDRGSFEALYLKAVDNECRFFWRTWQRREKRHLQLVHEPEVTPNRSRTGAERAEKNQRRLLEALSPSERKAFATWALQRHLPRGRLNAAGASRSLGLTVREWENAKRRLKTRIDGLLAAWDMSPHALFSLEDDERPARSTRA